MVEFFNHFTFNTGHNRKTYASEISKEFLFNFLPTVKEAINNGICDFVCNVKIEITVEDGDYYVATIYHEDGKDLIPIFTTSATSNKDKRKQIIKDAGIMKEVCRIDDMIHLAPDAPLIIDFVLPSIMIRPDIMSMTGDMSRCLAWAILCPQAVLN